MTIWLDAHLSPLLAPWIAGEFGCECKPFRELGFQSSPDRTVYLAARLANATILSKDSDFAEIQRLLGPPPKVIWLRCGNRTNEAMKTILARTLSSVFKLLETDNLVEVKDGPG